KTQKKTLSPESLRDQRTGLVLPLRGELFALVLTNGGFIHASEFKLASAPHTEALAANPGASRFAERLPGTQLVAELVSADGNLHVRWRAILRDGSRYLRQQVTFQVGQRQIPLKEIVLLETAVPNARTTGTVDGSPVVTETAFFGVEHPLSVNRGEMGYVRCFLPRGTPLRAGESFECSSVIGFIPRGQLRRGFLAYLERERAHPYRPFLHYNSWYDIGYFSKFNEKAALDVINAYGEELVKKRGVKLDSFMFDDGWDDYRTLWRFHEGFPQGFTPIREATARYGAAPGIWLSPWGGYGNPHDERIKYGKEQGFEINDGNFSMAGPKYYERFRSLCVDVVQKYGINQFKFDGIGVGTKNDPSAGLRDFEAMLRLIAELRALKPDLYINQTTGTWPSPFWLLHADSIWRGGEDHSFVQGREPERQRWITYKDNDVYEGIVGKGDLYPLNSLMLHGIIYARHAHGLNSDTNNAFKSEVRAFFGCGTQLQEMYITPSLLSAENWDALAEAAKWSRENAETLVDTHWVGGSPAEHKVYGWASWSPKKGILALRNPSTRPAEIKIDPAKAFELPEGSPREYSLVNPFKDRELELTKLRAGEAATFKLKPLEVLVVEALPAK
ncbi:MAG: enterotoxin, partial [Verrucomicrobia bacterium]|nr:enterotoxin [Verrucomicrobiota bacterium]